MTKISVLWNVLRGRPVLYRVIFDGTVSIGVMENMIMAECTVIGDSECSGILQADVRAAMAERGAG